MSKQLQKEFEFSRQVNAIIHDKEINGPGWQYYLQGPYLRAYSSYKGYDGLVRNDDGTPFIANLSILKQKPFGN